MKAVGFDQPLCIDPFGAGKSDTWESRLRNAFGGITTILKDGDLLIGGAFSIKRVIGQWHRASELTEPSA